MAWRRKRQVYVDDLPRTHDARFLLLFLLVVAGILGALYAVGYVVAGDKVPTGTTVVGSSVGGKSREEAATVLEHDVSALLRRPMTASAQGRAITVVPAQAGVSFDVEATLDDGMGGTDWNPAHMLKVLEGGGDVAPVLHVDRSDLRTALAPLAAKVSVPPVSATVTAPAGRPVVHPGQPGQHLDMSSAPGALMAALQESKDSVRFAVSPIAPTVGADAATAFVNETLKPALSGPVVVVVAGKPLSVAPSQFGPALRVVESSGGLTLEMAPDALVIRTAGLLRTAPGRPRDARIVFPLGSTPLVVPSKPGKVVDKQSWATAVFEAATAADDHRTTARLTAAEPDFTTSDARALQVEVPIAMSTATLDPHTAKSLGPAVSRLDATVVYPGAEFSYLHAVAPRAASTLTSALSAAVQSAAEQAGVTITKRPAAPPYGHDLAFRNTSNYPIYIRSWVVTSAGSAVHVQLWSSRASL